MEHLAIEYWVVFQLILDLLLVVLILFFFRSVKSGLRREAAREAAQQVIGLIEPLLNEAQGAAATFENQLKEKNRLVRSLNERLDSRIISLNLLLNRAKSHLSSARKDGAEGPNHIYDQQEAILMLHNENHDVEEIAKKLSMPKGEVDLVIDLKKKFMAGE